MPEDALEARCGDGFLLFRKKLRLSCELVEVNHVDVVIVSDLLLSAECLEGVGGDARKARALYRDVLLKGFWLCCLELWS